MTGANLRLRKYVRAGQAAIYAPEVVASIEPGDTNDQHKMQVVGDDEVQEAPAAEQIKRSQASPMECPPARTGRVSSQDHELVG
ncbi:hypothetical protein ACIBH1_48890 [Nonomuraea sp. NPDC050663]|uniref:hypothetical protein n=1 Tax=Nonomuraea sp. NPDC050663 TaxID=3364370 RepID=UPI0037B0ABE9